MPTTISTSFNPHVDAIQIDIRFTCPICGLDLGQSQLVSREMAARAPMMPQVLCDLPTHLARHPHTDEQWKQAYFRFQHPEQRPPVSASVSELDAVMKIRNALYGTF